MMENTFFSQAEYKARQGVLIRAIAEQKLDGVLVSAPENIYYLTGYQTKAVFTFQFVLVLPTGEIQVFTRQMEVVNAILAKQAGGIDGYTVYQDDEDAMTVAKAFLKKNLPSKGRIGIELNSWCMPASRANCFIDGLDHLTFVDFSTIIDRQRYVKSSSEIEALRAAAKMGDIMADKVLEATVAGASERDLCSILMSQMASGGSEYPGSWPNVMVGERTGLIHAAWGDATLAANDHATMEVTGVYQRYHAPSARTVFVGQADKELVAFAEGIEAARQAAIAAFEIGRPLSDLQKAAAAKLTSVAHLGTFAKRCGYSLGIGFPPSWGAQWQVGLNDLVEDEIVEGMAFHIVVVGHRPDGRAVFCGSTVISGANGPEQLTRGGFFFNA